MDEDNSTSESCEIISEPNEVQSRTDGYVDEGEEGEEAIEEQGGEKNWRGCSMYEIYKNLSPFELDHVATVKPSAEHTVLYRYPIREPDSEPPRPLKAHPRWDAQHVRLPCSGKSQYPVTADDGSSTIESRWEMIEKALLRPITNSRELQAAILSYNTRYENQWDFKALHRLFEKDLDESESRVFFEDLLPRIIRLALRLPELVSAPIPLLRQNDAHSITLSQQQISSLLANAFLCTFPRRNTLKKKSEYTTFPDINFNNLFQSPGHSVLEKIKCICHYFRRVCPTERDSLNVPSGVVTFTRRNLQPDAVPNWPECEAPLGSVRLHITSEGTIEDQGLGLLQVDFANKYLGGGVLGTGCVQEEIRFVICPELMVSKLFTECLLPNEALLMVGCERYSNYCGYASSFKWAGNHEDLTPCDSSRRRMTHIVAIDALAFKESSHQFREELMLRELNKAYVGFRHTLVTPAPAVATGNWGCGAFGGEATLKALLQLMACAAAKRPLVYYTFGDKSLRDKVHNLHMLCAKDDMRVRDIWAIIKEFRSQKLPADELYKYIESQRTHAKRNRRRKEEYAVSAAIVSEAATAAGASCTIATAKPVRTLQPKPEEVICIEESASTSSANSLIPSRPSAQSKALHITTSPNDAQTMTTKKQESPRMRQRSLLEMLDACYKEGQKSTKCVTNSTVGGSSSPPSKRFCSSSQN